MTGDLDHDDVPEYHSTLEALDDVAAIVEAIVLSSVSDEEREAYLVLAGDYGSYAERLPEEPAVVSSSDPVTKWNHGGYPHRRYS